MVTGSDIKPEISNIHKKISHRIKPEIFISLSKAVWLEGHVVPFVDIAIHVPCKKTFRTIASKVKFPDQSVVNLGFLEMI